MVVMGFVVVVVVVFVCVCVCVCGLFATKKKDFFFLKG